MQKRVENPDSIKCVLKKSNLLIVSFAELNIKTGCYIGEVLLTLWEPAGFGDFRQKKYLNARGYADEYLRSCSL